MSPSRWWGHDPVVETVYEYDEAGRVTRSLAAPVEPEWSPEDRALMLALAEHEANICPNCGQPLDEAMDPDNEGRYRLSLPTRDHACTALAQFSKAYQHSDVPEALRFHVYLAD